MFFVRVGKGRPAPLQAKYRSQWSCTRRLLRLSLGIPHPDIPPAGSEIELGLVIPRLWHALCLPTGCESVESAVPTLSVRGLKGAGRRRAVVRSQNTGAHEVGNPTVQAFLFGNVGIRTGRTDCRKRSYTNKVLCFQSIANCRRIGSRIAVRESELNLYADDGSWGQALRETLSPEDERRLPRVPESRTAGARPREEPHGGHKPHRGSTKDARILPGRGLRGVVDRVASALRRCDACATPDRRTSSPA